MEKRHFETVQQAINTAYNEVGDEGDEKFIEAKVVFLDEARRKTPRHGEEIIVAGREALLQVNISDLR